MKKQLLLVMTVATVLVSCGGNSPSESDMIDVLKEHIPSATRGVVSVIDVSKTDGQLREDGVYIADYVAEVKFNKCLFIGGMVSVGRGWADVELLGRGCGAPPGETIKKPMHFREYGVGSVAKVPGKAWYIKKESGWKLRKITVDSD